MMAHLLLLLFGMASLALKLVVTPPLENEEQEVDENRTEFSSEEGMLLREFFDLLYQINEREKIC
jgi:hypothetical protein